MKNKEQENQSRRNQEGRRTRPTTDPLDDAELSPMPPEERIKVTRQNRFVTYFVPDNAEQRNSPQEKSKEKVSALVPTSEQAGLEEKGGQETTMGIKDGKSETPTVRVTPEKYNAEEKALSSFADVLISHLEKIEVGDWARPWIFKSDLKWPQNLDGREYAGGNALILLMHTQQRGYKAAVYATYDRFQKLNFVEGSKDQRVTDADGKPLPLVFVKEGQKHMPVIKTVYTAVHKETKERIPFSDYAQLPKSQQQEYNVYPRNFVYRVFNIDQTNLKEARPELYAELTKGVDGRKFTQINREEDMSFPAIDAMIYHQLWQCDIDVKYREQACYSLRDDKIFLPEKGQFKYPESYYGTLFHECAHSTGSPKRYNRDMGANDHKIYAREELVAELTAALVASRYGLMKHVKSDSLPYLKSWLNALKEKPEFIKQLLTDVRKASSQIIRRVDLIQKRVEELRNMGVPEPEYLPGFMEVDPHTHQPLADPALYFVSDKGYESQQQPAVGRGRR